MGYTHYWDRPDEIDKSIFDELRQEIAAALPEITNITGPLEIELTDDLITINGTERGDNAHKTFVFSRLQNDEDWPAFCKTARKPYDTAVCYALLLIRWFYPEIVVNSDGDIKDEGWANAWRIAENRGVIQHVYPWITKKGTLKFRLKT